MGTVRPWREFIYCHFLEQQQLVSTRNIAWNATWRSLSKTRKHSRGNVLYKAQLVVSGLRVRERICPTRDRAFVNDLER